MAAEYDTRMRKSNTQILQELEALSESLYQSHITRRTNSLVLPRTSVPPMNERDEVLIINQKPRSRRMSLSPWRSRPKPKLDYEENNNNTTTLSSQKNKWADDQEVSEKKGIWKWKPLRALAHIRMEKLSCLFSIEVITAQGLPSSMNGLRLSVCVRKKETKDGAVQTMPSRVSEGAADFEETLFIRSHVYFSHASNPTHMKFEPRPFLIYVFAVDAEELDFGRSSVDLSGLIQESIEKSFEGTRIRQWDVCFRLLGKAKGGELVLKLGFQIMEKDGGIGIYNQGNKKYTSSLARRQSKTSFSIPSPRMSGRPNLQGIDDLNLDEPAPKVTNSRQMKQFEDNDVPEFDVVEKGVEIQDKNEGEEEQSEENSDKRSVSSEVVKEVVQDQSHLRRLSELDSIAQQIKALESIMGQEKSVKTDEEIASSQTLDAFEDKVTREFLQMLEDGEDDDNKLKISNDQIHPMKLENDEVFLPDLGKGLGCIVQTRNGGYLAAANPLESKVSRKDTPKLVIQMSKPLIIQSNEMGFEFFQKMAAIGIQELTSDITSLMPLDDLTGKTAEQIAFEGIASAIIQGRNKEGATSTAAKTISAVKTMTSAMNIGRKERISTGIWNVREDPLTVDEILAFSMQKIETMAYDGLKIQADIAEEDAPFNVYAKTEETRLLASAVPLEDWIKVNTSNSDTITISLVVQLHDPIRQFEVVGGPMMALIHAKECHNSDNDEKKYRVESVQVGGVKVRTLIGGMNNNLWDDEEKKRTATQWLVAYGMGKTTKKGKRVAAKGQNDLLWSISSRILADMWLKPLRNPDVKFTK